MTVSSLRYNPLDASTLRDPYPFYARLRHAAPVHWDDKMRCWVLTRYKDCRTVLKNHRAFSNDWRAIGVSVPDVGINVQTIDPPVHSAVHSLLMNSVHNQDLAQFEVNVTRRTSELLALLAHRATFDLVSDLIELLCLESISEFFGVIPPERTFFSEVAHKIVRAMDVALMPEAREPGVVAKKELAALVDGWLASAPEFGVMGYLAKRLESEKGMSRSVLVNSIRVLFLAGSTSLAAAMANGVHACLREQALLHQLGNSEKLNSAVEELFRFDPAIQGTTRMCLTEIYLGDTLVRRGDGVLVLFGAANRDPEKFDRPDTLVLNRRPNPHLGFGWGVHACVGGFVAKVMMRALLVALARYPALRQVAPVEFREQATVRALSHLPVTLIPAESIC